MKLNLYPQYAYIRYDNSVWIFKGLHPKAYFVNFEFCSFCGYPESQEVLNVRSQNFYRAVYLGGIKIPSTSYWLN